MLEWVCPKCGRGVDPGLTKCPFCGYQEDTAAPAPAVRPQRAKLGSKAWWADVDRGFRFGLGFVAALAVCYFVVYMIAYYGGHGEWVDRLSAWLGLR